METIDIVRDVNAQTFQNCTRNGQGNDASAIITSSERLTLERHGAIRLGTPFELRTVKRIFGLLGLQPVGYYDLSIAGLPMHATCFRPTSVSSLNQNPFRVFTTLLRPELLASVEARQLALELLDKRKIFSNALLDILATAEAQGGRLTDDQAKTFIPQALATFSWQCIAAATFDQYQTLKAEHPILAEIDQVTNLLLDLTGDSELPPTPGLIDYPGYSDNAYTSMLLNPTGPLPFGKNDTDYSAGNGFDSNAAIFPI